MVFKSIQSIISFLTIIPGPKSSSSIGLDDVANTMHFFPVAGLIIGCIIGGLAYGISLYLEPILTGFIVTTALVLVTGLHHTDALADFADGLMTKGEKATKQSAMHDPAVGSAGVVAIVLYLIGMVIAVSSFHQGIKLLSSIIAAEVAAKFVMVMQAYMGISAWNGLSSPFTSSMKDKRKILTAAIISVLIILFTGTGYFGIISLGISLVIAAVVQHYSNKSFGGISGDVMGASNEITRLSSLIVLSTMMS